MYDEKITVHWPEDLDSRPTYIRASRRSPKADLSESMREGAAGNQVSKSGRCLPVSGGLLSYGPDAAPQEYYEGNMRNKAPHPAMDGQGIRY